MGSYRIEWKSSALKELRGIDRKEVSRVVRSIEELSSEPRPIGCRKLVGSTRSYRIRVGVYRVVYLVDDRERVVEVYRVRLRSNAYDNK
jgi:mRNA interferase RelE/StbE